MNNFFEMLYAKRLEKKAIISEMEDRTSSAISVLNDVYDECKEKLQMNQDILASLFEEGDFESVMKKLSETNELVSQTSDEAVRNRLDELNLKKCN